MTEENLQRVVVESPVHGRVLMDELAALKARCTKLGEDVHTLIERAEKAEAEARKVGALMAVVREARAQWADAELRYADRRYPDRTPQSHFRMRDLLDAAISTAPSQEPLGEAKDGLLASALSELQRFYCGIYCHHGNHGRRCTAAREALATPPAQSWQKVKAEIEAVVDAAMAMHEIHQKQQAGPDDLDFQDPLADDMREAGKNLFEKCDALRARQSSQDAQEKK